MNTLSSVLKKRRKELGLTPKLQAWWVSPKQQYSVGKVVI